MGDVHLDYDPWLNIICIKHIYILTWTFEKEKREQEIPLSEQIRQYWHVKFYFFIFLCVDDWIPEIERERIRDKGSTVSHLSTWTW